MSEKQPAQMFHPSGMLNHSWGYFYRYFVPLGHSSNSHDW